MRWVWNLIKRVIGKFDIFLKTLHKFGVSSSITLSHPVLLPIIYKIDFYF